MPDDHVGESRSRNDVSRRHPGKGMQAQEPPPRSQRGVPDPRVRTYHYSYTGRVGGFSGLLLGGLFFIALLAALVLGAVAVTVALWIGLSAVLIGVVIAVARRIFGPGQGPRQ